MFSIHISEKNGAERSESFDRAEISVGRVQGNDLMLPKGNVSKHHARFVYRDGRYVVTDLKSTNGTYVNGRRIAQATIVREGDSIHIGDFVLRLETASEGPVHSTRELSARSSDPSALGVTASTPPSGHAWLGGNYPERREERASAPPASVRPHPSVVAFLRPSQAPASRPGSMRPTEPPREASPQDGYTRALALLVARAHERLDPSLLDGAAGFDEASSSRGSRMVAELLRELRETGWASAFDEAMLLRDAHRELFELGPLGPLLEDDAVSEIQVVGFDRVVAKRGAKATTIEPAFSSERALLRAIARLCQRAGRPMAMGDKSVERVLPGGVAMQAFLEQARQPGQVLVLRKPHRSMFQLDDLVREGALSRKVASFLSQAVGLGANLLIVGAPGESHALGSALARTDDAQLVVLHAADRPSAAPGEAIALALPDCGAEGAKVLRAAVSLRSERLMVSPFAGQVAGELLDAIAEGAQGVLAIMGAPSLRQGLLRVGPDLAVSRPGIGSELVSEWLAASFDIVVEIARLRDGRQRVLRVGELIATQAGPLAVRDVFTFSIDRAAKDGDIEGSFLATGIVPRITEESALRSGGIDESLFRPARSEG